MVRINIKLKRILPLLVYGGITLCSSLPGSTEIIQKTSAFDKLQHFIAYGFLGLSLALSLPRAWLVGSRLIWTIFWALCVGMICAFLDEWHQSFVPGRYSDVYDGLADLLGYGVFLILALFIRKARQDRARSRL